MDTLFSPIRLHELEMLIEKSVKKANEKQAFLNTPPPPPDERFLDQKEVAELFGVSTVSIWQWEKNGFIKSYRIGNLKRFKYSEIINAPKFINRTKKGGVLK